ncbi:hypothetical protein [Agrobacterium sp. OT33]|uniref:hypothetical protein n=1 Tax=Agrobacterium sp. OT33 TaxID=2815338 RepID=UPI001A8CF01C|nr:hypothetical protein [Agrobacterium sp. OT33]MBO0125168.1 hypothetical protein [Agrobacterium sp. OT33]
MQSEMKPFNPQDQADLMADQIRCQVAMMAAALFETPEFRSLDTVKQIEAFTGGITTALMGVLFAFIENSGASHDEIEMFVTSYIPQARILAEAIASHGDQLQ